MITLYRIPDDSGPHNNSRSSSVKCVKSRYRITIEVIGHRVWGDQIASVLGHGSELFEFMGDGMHLLGMVMLHKPSNIPNDL